MLMMRRCRGWTVFRVWSVDRCSACCLLPGEGGEKSQLSWPAAAWQERTKLKPTHDWIRTPFMPVLTVPLQWSLKDHGSLKVDFIGPLSLPTDPTYRAPYPGPSVWAVSSAPVPACPLSRCCHTDCHVWRRVSRVTCQQPGPGWLPAVSPLATSNVTNFPDSSSLVVLVLGRARGAES